MADTLNRTEEEVSGFVEITRVSRTFQVEGREVQALDDVSLTIRPGEFISIVGPSGCGKSTLLRFLAGLDRPDAGSIKVDGKVVEKPGLKRGIVFQDHRLLPWLTVERNIALSLHSLPLPEEQKRQRVRHLIKLVGLGGFEHCLTSSPAACPSGRRSRAASPPGRRCCCLMNRSARSIH